VATWVGVEQYATAFLGNDVDGEVLPELPADDLISCRRLRLAGDQRLRGHARGQHDRDDAGLVAVMPDAVRRAQAMPQAVHDLVFAQADGLGDLNGRVFARQRGGADPRQGSTGL